MIYHIYRTNCWKASRVMMQANWLPENYFMHRVLPKVSGKWNEDELKLTKLLSIVKKSDNDVFIFHSYTSLAYLLFCIFIRFILKRNIRFVYDVHDIIEIEPNQRFFTKLKYKVWLWLESIAVRKYNIKVITVSKGLKSILEKRYKGLDVSLVYNCSIQTDITSDYLNRSSEVINSDKNFGYVFFGTAERFPYEICKVLNSVGVSVDVFGRGMSSEWLSSNYEQLENVRFKGEYNPEDLSFLEKYKFLILYAPSNRSENFKYSMPNKVFQAAAYGIRLLVSANFIEINETFKVIPGLCYLLPNTETDELCDILLEQASNSFLEYADVFNFLLSKKELSKNNYLKATYAN